MRIHRNPRKTIVTGNHQNLKSMQAIIAPGRSWGQRNTTHACSTKTPPPATLLHNGIQTPCLPPLRHTSQLPLLPHYGPCHIAYAAINPHPTIILACGMEMGTLPSSMRHASFIAVASLLCKCMEIQPIPSLWRRISNHRPYLHYGILHLKPKPSPALHTGVTQADANGASPSPTTTSASARCC